MKSVILVALALVAVAAAIPVEKEPIKILRSEQNQEPNGAFTSVFETENGITFTQVGEVKTVLDEENKPHDVVVLRGEYSYVDPDGNLQTITFVSDENGYRPEGPSIPKAPSRR